VVKFEIPEGWAVQAFRFTLDPIEDQARALARHFGARRKAYNWTVATLKADIEAWHVTGIAAAKPSLRVLRKRWNSVKDDVCVNAETGVVWWPECSKEAYADGIDGAVDAYWNWQTSRSGKRDGKPMGFPRFKKKGRDAIVCRSRPERCVSSPTGGTSRCRSSGPSARMRIRAGLNA
jgi:putative transposase